MFYKFLAFLLMATPLAATTSQAQKDKEVTHVHVNADQLKSWYDQKKDMVVLDARSKRYFDGTLLPNAKWVSVESSAKEIQAAVPSKDSLIVVYCLGVTCPASGWLYDKLTSLGYKNVFEYHEGLQDWIQKGFPTIKQ